VLISTVGSPVRDGFFGGLFGLALAVGGGLVIWGLQTLLGPHDYVWLVVLAALPVFVVGLTWVTKRGLVNISSGNFVFHRWWRHRSVPTSEITEVSCHGPRVIVSLGTGETVFLEWPWYLPMDERRKRAAYAFAQIKGALATTGAQGVAIQEKAGLSA
jgi:hypothetical protein